MVKRGHAMTHQTVANFDPVSMKLLRHGLKFFTTKNIASFIDTASFPLKSLAPFS